MCKMSNFFVSFLNLNLTVLHFQATKYLLYIHFEVAEVTGISNTSIATAFTDWMLFIVNHIMNCFPDHRYLMHHGMGKNQLWQKEIDHF